MSGYGQQKDKRGRRAQQKVQDPQVPAGRLTRQAPVRPKDAKLQAERPPLTQQDREKQGEVLKALRETQIKGSTGMQPGDVRAKTTVTRQMAQALAALGSTRLQTLSHAVTDNKNGTTTVRLFDKQANGQQNSAHLQTVDHLVPQNADAILSGQVDQQWQKLWPAIVEKAYAAWKGSYEAAGQGSAAEMMSALTGEKAVQLSTAGPQSQRVWTRMAAAIKAGNPVTAQFGGEDDDSGEIHADQAFTAGDGDEPRSLRLPEAPAETPHVDAEYVVVLATWGEGEDRRVLLRDPWAKGRDAADDDESDVFQISWAEFCQRYADVVILGVVPK